MATMEDLPKEIFMMIFSHYLQSEGHEEFLMNITRVCKHWNKLSSDSSLWRNVTALDWNFLLNVSRRGLLEHTQSLKYYRGGSIFSDENLSDVLKNIRDLKALELCPITLGSGAIKLVTEHCPHLERLHLEVPLDNNAVSHDLEQLLIVCGPTLKVLELMAYYCSQEEGQQLLSGIAAKCPLLEELLFFTDVAPFSIPEFRYVFKFFCSNNVPFPIYKLRSGCPRMKELQLYDCRLITAGRDDSLGCGFKDLKKFAAIDSDFKGFDIYSLLKDSMDLEHVVLENNKDLVFSNILKLPSDKVRILDIVLRDPDRNLEALGDAIYKWRHTLSVLNLGYWRCDISCVLPRLLQDNENPQLESLVTNKDIDRRFMEEFIQKCPSLIHLQIGDKEFKGREKFTEALEFLMKLDPSEDSSEDLSKDSSKDPSEAPSEDSSEDPSSDS